MAPPIATHALGVIIDVIDADIPHPGGLRAHRARILGDLADDRAANT
jgi:hypothetical protein